MEGEEKRYIFLTNEIGNVGGGQLYVVHKSRYYEEHGYRPGVAYFLESEILIDEMRHLPHRFIREMQLPFASTTRRVRRRALEKLRGLVGDSPAEVVMESYTPRVALWGEWFAMKLRERGLRVRHFLHNITEGVTLSAGGAKELTRFMIEDGRMRVLAAAYLQPYFPDLDCKSVEMHPEPHPGSPVEDVPFPQARQLDEGAFTMLSLGRLDKPYIMPMVESIVRFVDSHPEEGFNMIFIGGAPHARYLKGLSKIFDKSPNVKVIVTGPMYPIPRDAMRMADVMLGDSNSLKVARQEGVPPLAVDSLDFKGIGIYGETTESLLYRSIDEQPIEIESLLEWVYMEREQRRVLRRGFKPFVMERDYSRHERWLKTIGEECWPGIATLDPQTRVERLMRVVMALGGERLLYLLKSWKARLRSN